MNLSKNLEEFLKKKTLDDLINFRKLGFQANNLVLLETLEKLNKNIFNPKNIEKKLEQEFFSICRNGNLDIFNFLPFEESLDFFTFPLFSKVD